VISNQARFRREQVTFAGKATAWMRTADSGNAMTFHFCPTCGSTVFWEIALSGLMAELSGQATVTVNLHARSCDDGASNRRI
jgi:hypothetical protein